MSRISLLSFTSYSTPPASQLYSTHFFNNLTFSEVPTVFIPPLLPSGCLQSFTWSVKTPALPSQIQIAGSDVVPSNEDLRAIVSDMGNRFSLGYRSVDVMINLPSGSTFVATYHFQKVRILINLANYSHRVESAKKIWNRIHDLLPSTSQLIRQLSEAPINSRLCGFRSAVPLWQLSMLTQDDPIWDDAVSARLETSHFVSSYLGKNYIFLSPMLVDAVIREHEANGLEGSYSAIVSQLRNHILLEDCEGIGMVRCISNHHDGYVWNGAHSLHYSNSLISSDFCNTESARQLIPVFNWLLKDLNFPLITDIALIPTEQQALGTNSCALAALNGIKHFLGLTSAVWTPELSDVFRDSWLFDFLLLNQVFSDLPLPLAGPHSSVSNSPEAPFLQLLRSVTEIMDGDFEEESELFYCPDAFASDRCTTSLLQSESLMPPLSLLSAHPTSRSNSDEQVELDTHSSSSYKGISFTTVKDPDVISISSGSDSSRSSHVVILKGSQLSEARLRFRSAGIKEDAQDIKVPIKREEASHRLGIGEDSNNMDKKPVIPVRSERKPELKRHRSPTPPPLSQSYDNSHPPRNRLRGHSNLSNQASRVPSPQNTDPRSALNPCLLVGEAYLNLNDAIVALHAYENARALRSTLVTIEKARLSAVGVLYTIIFPSIKDHSSGTSVFPSLSTIMGVRFQRVQNLVGFQQQMRRSSLKKFNRRHLRRITDQKNGEENPDHPLEVRQLSNLLNSARREAREEVEKLGGDFPSIIAELERLRLEDPLWTFKTLTNDQAVVTALWWQSPKQRALAVRYYDILITDATVNRNVYDYALNIGMIIDNHCKSRCVWFCLQAREDAATHIWVHRQHLETAQNPPKVLVSDADTALRSMLSTVYPTTYHIICLHHLHGNILRNLSPVLQNQLKLFEQDFWH
ncbi:hypothetical protein SISNIDRAFT_468339, partial [Sistotremastrum niveocremeum HHB9708]